MDQSSLLGGSTTTNTAIDPNDLPAGFTLQDPHHNGGNTNISNGSTATNASMQQQQQQKQSMLEQVMEPDALARLRRIQLVKPQKATMLENAILQLATTNKLSEPISDGKFVEMLERQIAQEHRRSAHASTRNDNDDTTATLSSTSSASNINSSSGISIRRKKYAIDSDDDDENDDDLL